MSDVQSTGSTGAEVSSAPSSAPVESAAPAASAQPSAAPKTIAEKINAIHAAKSAKGAPATPGSPAPAQPVAPSAAAQVAAATAQAPEVNQPGGEAPATPLEQAVEAYKAKLKFRFKDQEKDIPELFHGLMKDQATEKQIHELFQKNAWFDENKPMFVNQTQELTKIKQGMDKLDTFITRDPKTNQIKDFGRFSQAFGLTDEDIFTYAAERLKYHNLPDDQRAQIDEARTSQERALELQEQNETLMQQQLDFQAETKRTQLNEMVKQPQIASIAGAHPGGEKGFLQAVAQNAYIHHMQTGQDLTPDQAILSYVNRFGLSAPAPGQQAPAPAPTAMAPVQSPQAPAAPVVAAPQAPTLPKVPSQGTSPTKKTVTRLSDIHKRRQELEAQQNG